MRLPQYKITQDRRTMLVLLALDGAAGIVVFNIIANFRGIAPHPIFSPLAYPLLLLAAAIFLIDGYNGRTDMLSVDYLSLHTIAVLAAMVATLLLTFAFFPVGYELHSSRGVIALGFVALIPITVGYRRLICMQTASGRSGSSFVFVGSRKGCQAFREECWRMGMQQAIINSEIGEGAETGDAPGPDILHRSIEAVLADAASGAITVEAIVLGDSATSLPAGLDQQLVRLFFQGVPTYTLEFFHQVYWHNIPLDGLDPAWLFQEGFQIAREPVFERMKRACDIFLACVGVLLAAPFIAVAAIAILAEERGPVFFRQSRVGMHGVPFQILKLRTMRTHAPHREGMYTQPGDSRVTRVGRLLRVTHLDEVPQIWNVLRGDMSLIGPRAEWDRLVEDYELKIPCYEFRHLVKPGITGWAQVNYPYGASLDDTLRKLEYDLYYIRNFSFTLDASIIIKTIQVMLFGKGR